MTAPPTIRDQALRLLEALLFLAPAPLSAAELADRLPPGSDVPALLARLEDDYAGRGITLVRAGDTWAFATALDLAAALAPEPPAERRLSRAAIETLAIIAYHQPVTRAEIEDLRGVQVGKGTLDVLIDQGWIAPAGRRPLPGRPLLWRTTDAFLHHFRLASLDELPGVEELRATGLLDSAPALPIYGEEADGA